MFGWLSKLLKPKPKVNPSAWVPPEFSEEERKAFLESTPKIDIHWGEEVAVEDSMSLTARYGGLPFGFPRDQWPLDPKGNPMFFIAQCPLQTPTVLSEKYKMAYAFMAKTYSEEGECYFETWDPKSKANRIVVIENPTDSFSDGPCLAHSRSFELHKGWQFDIPCGDDRPQIITYGFDGEEEDHEQGSFQYGGHPVWVQESAHPDDSSGEQMKFVFSLESEDFMLQDFIGDGVLYAFLSEQRPEESCLVWQCT